MRSALEYKYKRMKHLQRMENNKGMGFKREN